MDPLIRTFTIPELDRKGLRRFGYTIGGILAVLFGLGLPWLFGHSRPMWPWLLGGALSVWATVAPETLRALYRGWMRLALLLSRVTTPIVLGAVYLVIIIPAGIVMRLFRYDPMARRLHSAEESYRVPAKPAPTNHMEKPY